MCEFPNYLAPSFARYLAQARKAKWAASGCIFYCVRTRLRFGTPRDSLNDFPLCSAAEDIEADVDVAQFWLG